MVVVVVEVALAEVVEVSPSHRAIHYLPITNRKMNQMEIHEIAEKSAATTFLEGFMIDNGDSKTVDFEAWRASVTDDENNRRLAVGAIIVSEMREAVLKETQFTCSAGVAHNKVRKQIELLLMWL